MKTKIKYPESVEGYVKKHITYYQSLAARGYSISELKSQLQADYKADHQGWGGFINPRTLANALNANGIRALTMKEAMRYLLRDQSGPTWYSRFEMKKIFEQNCLLIENEEGFQSILESFESTKDLRRRVGKNGRLEYQISIRDESQKKRAPGKIQTLLGDISEKKFMELLAKAHQPDLLKKCKIQQLLNKDGTVPRDYYEIQLPRFKKPYIYIHYSRKSGFIRVGQSGNDLRRIRDHEDVYEKYSEEDIEVFILSDWENIDIEELQSRLQAEIDTKSATNPIIKF
jgi:hypothetical protein